MNQRYLQYLKTLGGGCDQPFQVPAHSFRDIKGPQHHEGISSLTHKGNSPTLLPQKRGFVSQIVELLKPIKDCTLCFVALGHIPVSFHDYLWSHLTAATVTYAAGHAGPSGTGGRTLIWWNDRLFYGFGTNAQVLSIQTVHLNMLYIYGMINRSASAIRH